MALMMSSPPQHTSPRDDRMSIGRLLVDDNEITHQTPSRPPYSRKNTYFSSDTSPTSYVTPRTSSIRFDNSAQSSCPRTAPWWSAAAAPPSEPCSSRSNSFSRHDSVHYGSVSSKTYLNRHDSVHHYGPVSPTASIESEESRCHQINPHPHHHHHQHNHSNNNNSSSSSSINSRKMPRPPRPSYNEEQRFCIMYLRIVRDKSWPEIEDKFAELFNTRSKGGLTSVYYRIRKSWGLKDVLRSGPDKFDSDRRVVIRRATNFSHDFLAALGYFDLPSWSR
ncbi:hypothetical protein MBLNU230_g7899t1 [Neophaeotheca triangularis]